MSDDGDEHRNIDSRKEFIKAAMKEAMNEWLDRKFMQFGKWSLAGIGAAVTVALIYFILMTNGWSHIPQTFPHTSGH